MPLSMEEVLYEGTRPSATMQHNTASHKDHCDGPRASHMADYTPQGVALRKPSHFCPSSITSSHASKDSLSSTSSASSDTSGPNAPESIFSLDSAFGSTPSLELSFLKSTETVNYNPKRRRMSVQVKAVGPPTPEKYEANMVSRAQLESLTTDHPLPEQAQGKWMTKWRDFRYGAMSAYMRLWALVILTNLAVIIAMVCKVAVRPGSFTYGQAATATGANLLVAALMRHEHSINLLFRLATALPHRTPLAIRRQAAKVYSYGGVHSGCGISALLWYIVYTALAVVQFQGNQAESIALATTTALALLCLCIIIGMAHPTVRTRWHDQWEVSHRFSGWTAIALVWAQTLVVTISAAHHAHASIADVLIHTPTFWFLIVITCCLIYPWLRLRRRRVEAEVLSSHAVRLWFGGKTPPSCVGARLSHKPLTENHGFATIPNVVEPTPRDLESGLAYPEKAYAANNGATHAPTPSTSTFSTTTSTSSTPSQGRGPGYSVLVSRAGDFTSNLIEHPPTHIYTRGAPTRGVLHIAHLFRPLVVVATGSGIGPCLSFLHVYPHHPMRVIWSARAPLKTYGKEVVDAVLRADPEALIVDTQKMKQEGGGMVDLGAVSWAVAKEAGAEAVVIISNPSTTRKVVFGLESRGLPAFGAIFDS